ncbi:MAG: hypothetical protein QXS20_10160 [Candidatus Thorarchaeota archaeon]
MNRSSGHSDKLSEYVERRRLRDKLSNMLHMLGDDADDVLRWAAGEGRRRAEEQKDPNLAGKLAYEALAREAATRMVQRNATHGRLTTRAELKRLTGIPMEMLNVYREAGLRHPQEARNLRHNIFHESFTAFLAREFPDVSMHVPQTGNGLTPDLIVTHKNPDWTIAVEYKGYRSLTLLSESELLKGMRYQAEWGTAWLVTTTTKSVRSLYTGDITSDDLVRNGIDRLRAVAKRKVFTAEQMESRAIAKKGIAHLSKHGSKVLSCRLISADELLKSCHEGSPIKGLAVTTGLELAQIIRRAGLEREADNIIRIMKTSTDSIHSDTVTSTHLVEN